MPIKKTVANLMCFIPSVFEFRLIAIEQDSLSIWLPQRFEAEFPHSVKQDARPGQYLLSGDCHPVNCLLQNAFICGGVPIEVQLQQMPNIVKAQRRFDDTDITKHLCHP